MRDEFWRLLLFCTSVMTVCHGSSGASRRGKGWERKGESANSRCRVVGSNGAEQQEALQTHICCVFFIALRCIYLHVYRV